MNSAMSLQQSVLMDVASLMNDNRAMKRLRAVLDELKKADDKEEFISKEEILDDIRDGLVELKLVKQGKLRSRPLTELINEL